MTKKSAFLWTLFLSFAANLPADFPTSLAIDAAAENWAQPAASGRVESALFGMVRDAGTRFHEGIDIKTVFRTGSGEPFDLVRAAAAGTVSHVCRENNGSYGRYIVLRHREQGCEFYTLYAHLSAAAENLSAGTPVSAGTILGVTGRTSTVFNISKSAAHLHFEVGMALGGNGFDRFMERRYGKNSNLHGHDNGFNLVGGDPVAFFQCGGFYKWLKNQSVDFSAIVPAKTVPELKTRSPELFRGKSVPGAFNAWRVDFTWFGMPLKFTPVNVPAADKILVESVAPENKQFAVGRKILTPGGEAGETLLNYLSIIFDEDFKND